MLDGKIHVCRIKYKLFSIYLCNRTPSRRSLIPKGLFFHCFYRGNREKHLQFRKNRYICTPVKTADVKHTREYSIAFVGLKPGEHEFNYVVDDKFFETYGEQDFQDAAIQVKLTLDKKSGSFLLHFDIDGTVTLPCDRCGDDFALRLWDEFDMMVKIVDDEAVNNKSDEDAEVVYIGRSESYLEIADMLYECIRLSIPMQRVHPLNSEGQSTCNPNALRLLEENNPQQTPNPIWDALKNIKS